MIDDQSTGCDARKQFLANLEDSINSAVYLPASIQRYQDVLAHARSKVDFVVGHGLYMLPSDLRLLIGMIQNYNNEILIAGDDQDLGHNKWLNTRPAPSILKKVPSPEKAESDPPPVISAQQPESSPESTPPVNVPYTDSHTSEKTARVVFLTFTGLAILYFTKN